MDFEASWSKQRLRNPYSGFYKKMQKTDERIFLWKRIRSRRAQSNLDFE